MFSPLGSKHMAINTLYVKEDDDITLIKLPWRKKQKTSEQKRLA